MAVTTTTRTQEVPAQLFQAEPAPIQAQAENTAAEPGIMDTGVNTNNETKNDDSNSGVSTTSEEGTNGEVQDLESQENESEKVFKNDEVQKLIQERVERERRIAAKREQDLLNEKNFILDQYNQKVAPQAQANQNNQNQPAINTGLPNNRMPTIEDFGGDANAFIQWNVQYELTKERIQFQQVAVAQQKAVEQKAWQDKVATAQAKHPDFMETINLYPPSALPDKAHEELHESDIGPELYYHFATHPEDRAALFEMTPAQIKRKIFALETKLAPTGGAGTNQTNQNRVSGAPQPLKTVNSTKSPTITDIYDPNISKEDFRRIRAEQKALANAKRTGVKA